MTPGKSKFCSAPARLIWNIYPLSATHSICPGSFHQSLLLMFTFHLRQTLAWLCLRFTICSAATLTNTLTLPLSSRGTLTKPTSGRSLLNFYQHVSCSTRGPNTLDHCCSPTMPAHYWLLANRTVRSTKFRIGYKIVLLAYKALNDLAPACLTNLLSRYNPTRSLRSQNSGLLVVPRIAKSTKGGRTFSYLAPKLWNSLPDNVRGSDTLSLFKSRLKTHLFSQAFI